MSKGTKKVGRDAGSGKFLSVEDAKKKKGSAIVKWSPGNRMVGLLQQ